MIGIRVDVNRTVATGHIQRDLSVARKLREMGQECLFISADENCIPYLKGEGFQAEILHSDWEHLEGETEQLCELLKKRRIHSLLVDSYYVTPVYMKWLSEMVRVTYFDELYLQGYGCQQVINGVLEPPDYKDYNGKAFTGASYVSLRDEFSNLPPKKIRSAISKLLVTSGGTDNYHFSKCFLEEFLERKEWQEVRVILVIGNLCCDREELLKKYEKNPSVEIYVNTNRMAELMQEADYALTAGGTTLYEVCAAGVAASSYVLGDNQVEITGSFDRLELISFAGDFRADRQGTIENILTQMRQAVPAEFRRERARRLQAVVDGQGAGRIAGILL